MIKRSFLSAFLVISLILMFSFLAWAKPAVIESEAQKKLALTMTTKDFTSFHALALKASNWALKNMELKSTKNLLIVTNAGYVNVNNKSAAPCLDALTAATGCTAGKGNLLVVHTSTYSPLYFFFFDKETDKAAYLEANTDLFKLNDRKMGFAEVMAEKEQTLFKFQSMEDIAYKKITTDPQNWSEKLRNKVFNGKEFSLVTIANLWAAGAPTELMQSALFHDHFCPGVTAGYYLARYLMEKLPLTGDQNYYIISSPAWCKDDALQVILNCTVGKAGMVVYPLSDTEKEFLLPVAKDATGIYFAYSKSNKTGKGVVLGFDWDRLCKDSGITFGKEYPWRDYLECELWMNRHLNDYACYVQVIKEFDLVKDTLPSDYVGPNINPWKKLGLWKDAVNTKK